MFECEECGSKLYIAQTGLFCFECTNEDDVSDVYIKKIERKISFKYNSS